MATMTRKIRFKKLSVKTALPVIREHEIDEYESLTEHQIATGVEAAEETEIHLQAVLKSAGVADDKEIPVPPPHESQVDYEALYPQTFAKTATYIRFSEQVEDCIDCLYDMTEEDVTFLNSYNEKRKDRLSEDVFERIMEVFEDTASEKTSFAAIDQTLPPYDEMLHSLQDLGSKKNHVKICAREIYEHWKSRRQALSNKRIHPTLKLEMHQDRDDMDPYVCFRRREVRQTRKTRARDVQSAEKLKRLRRELDESHQLIKLCYRREQTKLKMMAADRRIFDLRGQLKEQKMRLGMRTDDDDLINVKVRRRKKCTLARNLPLTVLQPQKKRPALEPTMMQRPPLHTGIKLSLRTDVRSVGVGEVELVQLADRQAAREKELLADIENKVQNHKDWNQNYVDLTVGPLSPAKGKMVDISFRPAKTQYLMTPPASEESESLEEPDRMDLDKPKNSLPLMSFRGVTQDHRRSPTDAPAYRRRIGRLNRLWIDRRGLQSPPRDRDGMQSDRWKYDQDSDDEEDQPVYEVDPFDTRALKFRATIPLPLWMTSRPGIQPPKPQAAMANFAKEPRVNCTDIGMPWPK